MKTATALRTLGLLNQHEMSATRAAARAFAAARVVKTDTARAAAALAAESAFQATAAAVKLNRAGLAGEGVWQSMRTARAAAVSVFHLIPCRDALTACAF